MYPLHRMLQLFLLTRKQEEMCVDDLHIVRNNGVSDAVCVVASCIYVEL